MSFSHTLRRRTLPMLRQSFLAAILMLASADAGAASSAATTRTDPAEVDAVAIAQVEAAHARFGKALAALKAQPFKVRFGGTYVEMAKIRPLDYDPQLGVGDLRDEENDLRRIVIPPDRRVTSSFAVIVQTTGRGDHSFEFIPTLIRPAHETMLLDRRHGYVRRAGGGSLNVEYSVKSYLNDEVRGGPEVISLAADDPFDSLAMASPSAAAWIATKMRFTTIDDPVAEHAPASRAWRRDAATGLLWLREVRKSKNYTMNKGGPPVELVREVAFDPDRGHLPVKVEVEYAGNRGSIWDFDWQPAGEADPTFFRVDGFDLTRIGEVRPFILSGTWFPTSYVVLRPRDRERITPPADADDLLVVPADFAGSDFTQATVAANEATYAMMRAEAAARAEAASGFTTAVAGGSTSTRTYVIAGLVVLALLGVVAWAAWSRRKPELA